MMPWESKTIKRRVFRVPEKGNVLDFKMEKSRLDEYYEYVLRTPVDTNRCTFLEDLCSDNKEHS